MTEEEMQARIAELEASNEKLKADKATALGEKNRAKAAAEAAQEAADAAAEETARKANDLTALEASLTKKYQKQIDDLTRTNEASQSQLQTLLIDNAIATKLGEAGVLPWASEAVTAMMKAGAIVKDGQAMVGDLPLADHIAGYLGSEAGKHFVAAPQNGGAGATGSTAKAASHDFTRENFSSRMDEWAIMQKSNPDQAKEIAISVGRSDLV